MDEHYYYELCKKILYTESNDINLDVTSIITYFYNKIYLFIEEDRNNLNEEYLVKNCNAIYKNFSTKCKNIESEITTSKINSFINENYNTLEELRSFQTIIIEELNNNMSVDTNILNLINFTTVIIMIILEYNKSIRFLCDKHNEICNFWYNEKHTSSNFPKSFLYNNHEKKLTETYLRNLFKSYSEVLQQIQNQRDKTYLKTTIEDIIIPDYVKTIIVHLLKPNNPESKWLLTVELPGSHINKIINNYVNDKTFLEVSFESAIFDGLLGNSFEVLMHDINHFNRSSPKLTSVLKNIFNKIGYENLTMGDKMYVYYLIHETTKISKGTEYKNDMVEFDYHENELLLNYIGRVSRTIDTIRYTIKDNLFETLPKKIQNEFKDIAPEYLTDEWVDKFNAAYFGGNGKKLPTKKDKDKLYFDSDLLERIKNFRKEIKKYLSGIKERFDEKYANSTSSEIEHINEINLNTPEHISKKLKKGGQLLIKKNKKPTKKQNCKNNFRRKTQKIN